MLRRSLFKAVVALAGTAGLAPMIYTLLLALGMLLTPSPARSQLVPGSMDVHWNEGASDCSKSSAPPLQVHQYNPQTFILRENLCMTYEGPFMYLLVGSTKALLVDTGDVADPNQVPLANTVLHLLSTDRSRKIPLLVVHTHRHQDHRAGDSQFMQLSDVQVVGFDIDSVRHYYNFTNWPNGLAQIDLGDRTVDVIPTPGHNETEVSFYDRNTGLLFTGDFLMPARLLIDDTSADLASAERVAAFAKDRPISFVLGGHIELNSAGDFFSGESQFHPQEHVLQMTKDDVLALPAAVRSFNGVYTVRGKFTMDNPVRILVALAVLVIAVMVPLVWMLIRYIRGRKRAHTLRTEIQG
ncbi:MAG TPA: MBL fold metallo-hydrolase [Candidatus Acidoferrum sp.]|nr:MBL fold metallo-hydrolase [Candidatus Acidoferrum sp.]